MGTCYNDNSCRIVFWFKSSNKKENVANSSDSRFGCFGHNRVWGIKDMKRKKFGLALIVLFTILSLSGCSYFDAKKEAKANRNDHEEEFIQIVETELGPDYALSNVQGYVDRSISDYEFFPTYSAPSKLTGEIEHDGKKYNAMYDYDKGILYSDVFTEDIIDSLAQILGMDKSQITYGCIINHNDRYFPLQFPTGNRTFEDMQVSYKGGNVEFYIVTSENVYGFDFEEYRKLCELKQSEFNVYILISDDFQNPEHFKKNFYAIRDIGEQHPVVDYEYETKDVYDVYNLQGFVHINDGFNDKFGDVEVERY